MAFSRLHSPKLGEAVRIYTLLALPKMGDIYYI